MRRKTVLASCLALALACGLITAAGASATLPELGRCVKVTAGTGGYNRANCVAVSKTHTGEYEWLPGPGANNAVKLSIRQLLFETTGGKQITCTFLFANGELTGAKTMKFSNGVELQGCALVGAGLACYTNPLEPNRVVNQPALVGELGDIPGSINPSNPWLGWDLKAESQLSPTMLEFKCGEAGGGPAPPIYEVSLEGSVIGRVKPTNKMVSGFVLVYKQEKGIQKPTAFIGGLEDVLTQITTPIANPTNKKTEQAGLQGGGPMEVGEPLEIKAKA